MAPSSPAVMLEADTRLRDAAAGADTLNLRDTTEARPAAKHDALWRFAETPHVFRYTIMGVHVEVATNAPVLAQLVERTFAHWPRPGSDAVLAARMRVFLHDIDGPDGYAGAAQPVMRLQGPYFVLSAAKTIAFADRADGFAAAYITPTVAADPGFVRVAILECLALYLVTNVRRGALHAAAVVVDGRCVLLTGPCGAGKSTLTYACLRAGMGIAAEDVIYVDESSDGLSMWGNPWFLHVPPSSARFFPELEACEPVRELSGETKYIIDVESRCPGAGSPHAVIHGVLELKRTDSPISRIVPADPDRLRETLAHFRHNVGEREGGEMLAAADRVLSARTGGLIVGSDLDHAVDTVREWLAG